MSTELEKFVKNETELGSFYYIASPYTHSDSKVQAQRVSDVAKVVKHIALEWKGIVPFSPVLYTSTLVCDGMQDVPGGWYHFDLSFLRKADVLMILELEGWESSIGIAIEKAFAESRGLRIVRYTLEEVLEGELPF